ncbi:MAG: hypothetical protein WAO83_15310 [Fuerstiella sp.]
MDPRLRYKTTQAQSWTRIDMLIHIYDHAISSLEAGAAALNAGKNLNEGSFRRDASERVMLIVDGLALEAGELPQNILRLCTFVMDRIYTNDAAAWSHSAQLLATVRSGFEEIRDEANAAEACGQIPAVNFAGVA